MSFLLDAAALDGLGLLELRREHAFDPGVAAHVPSAPERADSYLAGLDVRMRQILGIRSGAPAEERCRGSYAVKGVAGVDVVVAAAALVVVVLLLFVRGHGRRGRAPAPPGRLLGRRDAHAARPAPRRRRAVAGERRHCAADEHQAR